jgi:hypothetical protein
MDIQGAGLLIVAVTVLVMVGAAVVLSIAAVWFGMHVVAPRIRRALDRAETEEQQPVDRPG